MKFPKLPTWPLDRLNVKLTLGLIAGLFCVGVPFFLTFYYFHRDQLLNGLKTSTSSLSRLVVGSLESAMLQRTPHVLQQEVVLLSRQSGVERIMILDAFGEVQVSSDEQTLGARFDRDKDPTCVVCHRLVAPRRESTTIVESPSGEVFRNMSLIPNGPRCRTCHTSDRTYNGMLIMDLSMAPIRRQLASSMKQMLMLAAVMVLVTILVLRLLMKKLILRRLHLFRRVTSRVREGELGESVPVDSGDEIGELAESFNVMTGSLRSSFDELQQQRQFLENVINTIRDEITVFDATGRVVTANVAARVGPLHDRGESRSDLVLETLETGRAATRLETTVTPQDEERHLEVHTYPLLSEDGEVEQVIQVIRDLTERKYLEAHLRHSERLASLGLLASGFSHEINNPLASISTGVEGLLRKLERKEVDSDVIGEMEDYLHLIRGELHRAKEITSRILVLSQPSGGPPSIIDVGYVVRETLDLLRYRATQSGIEMGEVSEASTAFVKGDEPALRQVFLNLMLNAVQASGNRGEIRTEVWSVDGRVGISIRDSGCGIAARDLTRIFEPFFSKRRGERGSGLGLFIASSIVDQMGGHIEVDSTLGKGTEFRVLLPRA